jgi:hypothetical protein
MMFLVIKKTNLQKERRKKMDVDVIQLIIIGIISALIIGVL